MYMYMLGVLCCFALFVYLTLLASFFLPSHLSFKNMYMYMYMISHLKTCTCICTHTHTQDHLLRQAKHRVIGTPPAQHVSDEVFLPVVSGEDGDALRRVTL